MKNNSIIYAAKFKGIGKNETSYPDRGIAIYEMVVKYGFAEPMTSSVRNKFDAFCFLFTDITDPVFHDFNYDRRYRRHQFRLNEEDMERRILCTSFDNDYEAVIQGIQKISKKLNIDFVKDDEALPELIKWVPCLILYDREKKLE